MVCKKSFQIKVLDTIELNAVTREFKNEDGKLVIKHKVTIGQWGVLNVGITKF